jgi:hypothetical protein
MEIKCLGFGSLLFLTIVVVSLFLFMFGGGLIFKIINPMTYIRFTKDMAGTAVSDPLKLFSPGWWFGQLPSGPFSGWAFKGIMGSLVGYYALGYVLDCKGKRGGGPAFTVATAAPAPAAAAE